MKIAISVCVLAVFWTMRTFLVDSAVPSSYRITMEATDVNLPNFEQNLKNSVDKPDHYWAMMEQRLDFCATGATYYLRNDGTSGPVAIAGMNMFIPLSKFAYYHMKECCNGAAITAATAEKHISDVAGTCYAMVNRAGDINGQAVGNDIDACKRLFVGNPKPGRAQLGTFMDEKMAPCLTRASAEAGVDAATITNKAATIKTSAVATYGKIFDEGAPDPATGPAQIQDNCVQVATYIHEACKGSMKIALEARRQKLPAI